MPAAYVPMVIDQGEDWTTDVVWTDNFDNPQSVVHPCRMDIKTTTGTTIHQLETDPDIPDGTVPSINISTEIGLIQLHIPAATTGSFSPGDYVYDLFVTVDDGNTYAGPQVTRLVYGPVSVNKRYTLM